jgi:hypothetical protein
MDKNGAYGGVSNTRAYRGFRIPIDKNGSPYGYEASK